LQDLVLVDSKFDPNPFWEVPLTSNSPVAFSDTNIFDQDGYDLCSVEQSYALKNKTTVNKVINHRSAIVQSWMSQPYKKEGAVLNHSNLFERKGYTGRALEQLKGWANVLPIFYRLINIRPKWGLDFSMDYYDSHGNTFEVLHWEFDGFDFNEINDKKQQVEQLLVSMDWDDVANGILKRKDEWFSLDYFAQQDYKCKYIGIESDRWKMVIWS
jgi:hypothetical protein